MKRLQQSANQNKPICVKVENKPEYEEKTLLEMGVTSDVENWDQIQQPEKEDMEILAAIMFRNFKCTDLTVTIGEDKLICHMFVLQLYSEYFQALDYIAQIELPVEHVTAAAFVQVYAWMLECKEASLKRENFIEVCNAAVFLKIPKLIKKMWGRLSNFELLSEDKAYFLYLEARNYETDISRTITIGMLQRVERFFLILVASLDFVEMNIEHVLILLRSSELGPRREVDVFYSAVRWLFYDYDSRKRYVIEIMSCVRFGLFSADMLLYLKRSCETPEVKVILQIDEVIKMIHTGMSYFLTKKFSKCFYSEIEVLKLAYQNERQYICDENWIVEKNIEEMSYEYFIKYLNYLNKQDINYWKQFKIVSEVTI